MARLAVKPVTGKHPVLRYEFDRLALARWFGGVDRLPELCAVYGLPWPQASANGRIPFIITAPVLAVLLELAERMHKPLDLYQYVVQVR